MTFKPSFHNKVKEIIGKDKSIITGACCNNHARPWRNQLRKEQLKRLDKVEDNLTKCEHSKDAIKYNPYNKVTQCHKCGETMPKLKTFEQGQLDIICYIHVWVKMNNFERNVTIKKLLKDLFTLKKEIQVREKLLEKEKK